MITQGRVIAVVVGAMVLGGLCGGAVAYATAGSGDGGAGPGGMYVPKPLQTNARGLTYGSAADATGPGTEPDLVRVEASNGRIGYAYSADLDGPMPTTLAEAVAQNAQNEHGRSVPVYLADGTTRIGTFIAGGQGSSSRLVTAPTP